jgi:hypothetical protein
MLADSPAQRTYWSAFRSLSLPVPRITIGTPRVSKRRTMYQGLRKAPDSGWREKLLQSNGITQSC